MYLGVTVLKIYDCISNGNLKFYDVPDLQSYTILGEILIYATAIRYWYITRASKGREGDRKDEVAGGGGEPKED